jgi:hypothetical protein
MPYLCTTSLKESTAPRQVMAAIVPKVASPLKYTQLLLVNNAQNQQVRCAALLQVSIGDSAAGAVSGRVEPRREPRAPTGPGCAVCHHHPQ